MRRLRVLPRRLRVLRGPADSTRLAEALRGGSLYFVGLPWTGKTVAALWIAVLASGRGMVLHVAHKKSSLARGAYSVEEWVLVHEGGSGRVVTLSLDPHLPVHVYSVMASSAVAALTSWARGSIDPLGFVLERHARPGLASRLRSRIRAWSVYSVLSGVLDTVLALTTGLGVSTLSSLARSIASFAGERGVEGVPVVLDDLEALDPPRRAALTESFTAPLRCRGIALVRALPPGEALPPPGGDPEAFLYLQSAGLATDCTRLEGASQRLVVVQPDLDLTARIVQELGALVDPERVARESHGLPGVAVARLLGGMLEAMGSRVGRVEELVGYITGRTSLQEPLAPLLSQGGPLWADTAAQVARVLAGKILEASRSPRVLGGLDPAERGRLRLQLLEAANKLAVRSILDEYAPSADVATARVAGDGRLLIMLREELGDFLFSAVPATVEQWSPEGRLLATLLAEAPRAAFEATEKSNPLLDLFTTRLAHYAAVNGLGDYGEYYRIYAVSLTSLLLNTPGLALQAPILEPPEEMDDLTAIAALKLAYQLYESSTNNPGLIASLSGLGLEGLAERFHDRGGLVGLLALAALAAKARLAGDTAGTVEAASRASRAEAGDCASGVVRARILLETASALLEEGREKVGEGLRLLREAARVLEGLPSDPRGCDEQGLSLLYYPNRHPETLYVEDLHELRAYSMYLHGLALLRECDTRAPGQLIAAAEELAAMYSLRPYYVLHNVVTTLHKAIQAIALVSPEPCTEEVRLEAPGDQPLSTTTRGVHRAQWTLYEYATRYPNITGSDVLDALYAQYVVLSKYCGDPPAPARHGLGESGRRLLDMIEGGACPPPPCRRSGLEGLGCV